MLEIGGGLGELHVELLRRGAATATNVELSRSWDAQAERLLAEHGLAEHVERLIGDLVADPDLASEADIVVLNRVVCCYPDHIGLLDAAAARARRVLVFSYPSRNVAVRAGMAAINAWQRIKNRGYRTFAHRPSSMFEVLESAGLRPYAQARRGIWQVCALERVDVLEPTG